MLRARGGRISRQSHFHSAVFALTSERGGKNSIKTRSFFTEEDFRFSFRVIIPRDE